MVDLNTLAEELGAAAAQVHARTAAAAEVERTIYVVQARCTTPDKRDSAKKNVRLQAVCSPRV